MRRSESKRQMMFVAAMGAAIVCAGVTGYRVIMGWPLIDCLYMTVITLTTVGFSEVREMSDAGRIFTMLLIVGGVFTIGFSVRVMAEFVVEQNFFENFGRRRMDRRIALMKDHVIVCGYGRIGQHVVGALKGAGRDFVIVDSGVREGQIEEGTAFIAGDATDEENLKKAGIERAGVLIAVVGSDADNLFITMTARGLQPKLRIISRAAESGTRNKMLRAGADTVVLPYEIGGRRIASMALTPSVCEFLDMVAYAGGEELRMEEVEVAARGWLRGKSIVGSDIRKKTGVVVLAVKKNSGDMLSNPPNDMVMLEGDRLICLGTPDQIDMLKKLATREEEKV